MKSVNANKVKLISLVGSILICVGVLSACHSEADNPLLKHSKVEVVKFLFQAEQYAANKTHFFDGTRDTYTTCVENPEKYDNPFDHHIPNPCSNFLNAMLAYVNSGQNKNPDFKYLSMSDLKDKKAVDRIKQLLVDDESVYGQIDQLPASERKG